MKGLLGSGAFENFHLPPPGAERFRPGKIILGKCTLVSEFSVQRASSNQGAIIWSGRASPTEGIGQRAFQALFPYLFLLPPTPNFSTQARGAVFQPPGLCGCTTWKVALHWPLPFPLLCPCSRAQTSEPPACPVPPRPPLAGAPTCGLTEHPGTGGKWTVAHSHTSSRRAARGLNETV